MLRHDICQSPLEYQTKPHYHNLIRTIDPRVLWAYFVSEVHQLVNHFLHGLLKLLQIRPNQAFQKMNHHVRLLRVSDRFHHLFEAQQKHDDNPKILFRYHINQCF